MKKISVVLVICMLLSGFGCFAASAADEDSTAVEASVNLSGSEPLLAFPGAEGGGKYTRGARGVVDNALETPDPSSTAEPKPTTVEVYHVTNLNADGDGSFADAISREGRIVVFDVGGVIHLPNSLKINKNNITILGQTAPGDGITLAGSDLQVGYGVQNVIIRYLRVRPTDDTGNEVDGIGGQWNTDIIIDHCSTSWCIDECLTLYAGSAENEREQGKRLTVQNTISSESLRMSNHFKGAHGYGGIIGGTNATYYRNLFAHHDSRSPRLDRVLNKTDFRNNVVYNWGVTNSAYGGEPTSPHNQVIRPSLVNYSNNYYKFGPSTVAGKRYRIYDFAKLAKEIDGVTYKSKFYLTDNYVYGSSTVTNNNWANDGINSAADQVEKATEPFSLGDDLYPDLNIPSDKLLAGADCLNILSDVGATFPRRDSIDARVIADVINQTGRVINKDEEVGGFTGIEETHRTYEIPQDWKAANGMTSEMKDADLVESGKWAGYTWIETYVNEWTEQQSATAPTNPTVTVTSPAIAAMNGTSNKSKWAVIKDTDTLSYKASATPVGDTSIIRMELHDDETLLKTYDGASEINDVITLPKGTHYLSCVAYNNLGESTRSTTSIVYVNGSTPPSGWSHTQIGSPSYSGKGSSSYDESTGKYMISGSGKIGSTADKCDFMYQQVTGDFDISLKMEEIPKNENGPAFGLMVRESLDAGSRMATLEDGWIKFGRNNRIVARTTKNKGIVTDSENSNSTDNKMGIFMRTKQGVIISGNVLGEHPYDTSENGTYHLPNYLRIQRSGDTLRFSVSDSGTDWTDNSRQPYTMNINGLTNKLYVGVAIDSQQGQSDASPQLYYSQAEFSGLTLKNESGFDPGATESPTPTPDSNLTDYPGWYVGQVSADGTDGAAVQVEYEGQKAVQIQARNVYAPLDKVYNEGVVNFNTDLYVSPFDKNGFRIYLENDKAKNYQDSANNLGGVFAEIVNTNNGSFCTGPALGTTNAAYDFSGETAGWFNIDISLDYTKGSSASDFITVKVTNAAGVEVVNANMPAIEGIDAGLKQIRLVARGIQPYFANMSIPGGIGEPSEAPDADNAVFVKNCEYITGGTGKVTVKNTTAEAKPVQVLVAQYSSKLITAADFQTATIASGETADFTFTGLNQETARVFVWDENYAPYCNSFELKAKAN